jgi:uncharacterized protein (UPF0218 family)
MTIAYSLPPEMRAKLKDPLGTLIRGSFVETTNRLKDVIREEQPPCIVAVGDTVSKNLERSQILPKLSIIDNKSMRKHARPFASTAQETLHVQNPKATITDEAITAVRNSFGNGNRIQIVVDGEEDLLALVAVLYAPENSLVVYGQPYEGIVVIKVTQAKRTEISEILNTMQNARKAK